MTKLAIKRKTRKNTLENLKHTLNMILILNIDNTLAEYLQMSDELIDRQYEAEIKFELLNSYHYLYTNDEYVDLFNAIVEQRGLIQSRDEVLELLSQEIDEETKPKHLLKLLPNYVKNQNEEITLKTYILECNIQEFDEIEYNQLSKDIYNNCANKEPSGPQKRLHI